MENLERYNQVFKETFGIDESKAGKLAYQSIPLWDSIGHMALISALEEVFDIMMETDDIIGLSSYEKGITILRTKYDIEI
jgi:acyl carrier protein